MLLGCLLGCFEILLEFALWDDPRSDNGVDEVLALPLTFSKRCQQGVFPGVRPLSRDRQLVAGTQRREGSLPVASIYEPQVAVSELVGVQRIAEHRYVPRQRCGLHRRGLR